MIRNTRLRLALPLIAMLAAAAPGFAQERLTVKGTTVSLVPATGFKPASGFTGLQNDATSASLVVTELPPAAYEQVARIFGSLDAAKQNFGRQNVEAKRLEQIEIAGGKAPLVTGEQKLGDVAFDKWIALLKGERTVMLTVQSPKGAKLDQSAVRAMLASVTLGKPASAEEKLSALPFTIRQAAPFRLVEVLAGSTVLMTAGPLDVDPDATQPMLIASYQLAGGPSDDGLEPLGERLLKGTRGFETAEVQTREKTRFAGTDGFRLAGTHQGPKGDVRHFEHLIAFGPDGRYLRLIASGEAGGMAAVEGGLKSVADSVSFEKPR